MTTGSSLFSKITGGKKFDGLAIKRVYFGNWLRDYSQAIDIGTLSRGISPEIIRIVLWIMAFTEFGYGTKEFEVTIDRLGVYRAEEHIDNPKGYGEGIDARMYDKRLRGPVDPRELDIDSRTGLKNYICNEEGNWPTSSEYVRTSLHEAIARGRKARTSQGSDEDQYEAMRLLGQALHTLEDYSAHSNYCELVLRELGHTDVFPYVGSKCLIELGGRSVYPIVTGSFGGLDFVHSLMGGAQDSLSQIEIGQVQSSLENGANNSDAGENLKLLLDKLPFDLDEDFVTPFSQAAAAKAAADAQQAAAAAGSRSIGGSGGSAAGAGYGALMGLAANSMSGFGSTSTANTVPVTDPSVNNTANYDAEIDSGSIGDHKFDSMDIGSDIGEENSWRAMESQQKLQVDDNEETNEPEEESGKSEKSSDEESEKSSDKESNKSFDKESNKSSDEESNKSSDEESNKSSDEESNKSSDEESNKSSDEESNKSSDEEEPQEEYSSDRGFQSEEQEHEPEEEFEEEVEERESERESEEEPEKEYEPEEEEVEERPSRFRRFFRFVKENMSDD